MKVMSEAEKLELQQARVKLRESYLLAVSELIGEQCNIVTYENSSLSAKFSGWNPVGSEILVRDLQTPAAEHIDSAMLRTPDVIAVEFNRPIELP